MAQRTDRRRSPRFKADHHVTVSIVGTGCEHTGRLVDLSQKGLMFRTERSLGVFEAVKVEVGEYLWIGWVRHCRQEGGQFAVGVELAHHITKGELQELMGHYMAPALALISAANLCPGLRAL